MTSRRLLPALAVAAAVVLASCGSDGATDVSSQGPAATTTSTTTGAIGKGSNGFEGSDGSSSSPGSPGDPDAPVSTEPGSTDPAPPATEAAEVPNRTDLVDPRTVAPDELAVDEADPTKVHVRFWGGVPECYGAEASVAETPEAVVVTLRTGSVPDSAEACIDLAQHQQITLTLDAPVGDRTLEATPAS